MVPLNLNQTVVAVFRQITPAQWPWAAGAVSIQTEALRVVAALALV